VAPWLHCVGVREHAANSTVYDVSHVPFQTLSALTVLYLSSSSNNKQKSLYGFRMSTLLGWVGGDSFKYSHPFIILVSNEENHDFIAGQSTFSLKGALSNSRFVQFFNCQWTLVGVGNIIVIES
jgi:hypothetical protein